MCTSTTIRRNELHQCTEVEILLYIGRHCEKGKKVCLTIINIVKWTGSSHRKVKRIIHDLKDRGILVFRKYPSKFGYFTEYWLTEEGVDIYQHLSTGYPQKSLFC